MSDANWDMQYNKEYDLKMEILDLCKEYNIKLPIHKDKLYQLGEKELVTMLDILKQR